MLDDAKDAQVTLYLIDGALKALVLGLDSMDGEELTAAEIRGALTAVRALIDRALA